jgi:thiol-disulfide isomerase/thioredoxin
MRYLAFLLFICSTSICVKSQVLNFTLKGRINRDSKAEKVYLQGNYINIEIPITDDKEFFYKGTMAQAEECFIKTDKSYSWSLWITSGDIDVTLQEWELEKPDPSGKKLLKIAALSGPAETEKLHWFGTQRNLISSGFGKLSLSQYKDSMAKYFDPLLEQYILLYPHSKFSGHITSLANSRENAKKLVSLVDREVSKEERLSIENAIKRDSVTRNGLAVEDFEMRTIDGKMFTSKSLSPRYTLLEFWAHDCYPCRKQHPELIKLYNEYRTKGFEIVAIGVETSKVKWQKAVQQDKVPWIHVSDLKGWNNLLAKKYFVDAIPFNILIDENKKIVATHLSPIELKGKLKESFGN